MTSQSSYIPLADRAVLELRGNDTRTFLQGLITQDIAKLDGGPAFACLLTPQGKILFEFIAVEHGDTVLIDCDAESAPALAKRLKMYKLRADVSVTDRADLGIMAIPGTLSAAIPAGTLSGDAVVFDDPRLGDLGARAVVAREGENIAASGEAAIYSHHRLAMGVPQLGSDFSGDEMFLLDVNYDALGGVDYKKGCFVGQEVTSRMKRKGEIRRRTLMIAPNAASDDLPLRETPIMAGDSTLGEIIAPQSSAPSAAGLALIRLDRLEKAKAAGALIEAAGVALQIHVPPYLQKV